MYYLFWQQIALVYRLLAHEELHLHFVEMTESQRDPGFLGEYTTVIGLGACFSQEKSETVLFGRKKDAY